MQKEKVIEVLDSFADDVDLDALIEKLYLLRKIEIAEREIAAGQGIPHEEVKQRLEPWLK